MAGYSRIGLVFEAAASMKPPEFIVTHSQCHCQLQTHPSLYWRQGNIYCQRDYCRSVGPSPIQPPTRQPMRGLLACLQRHLGLLVYRCARMPPGTAAEVTGARTIMTSPGEGAWDLLYGSHRGDKVERVELHGSATGAEESAEGDDTTASCTQEPMMICAGCGERVCDRFFLLAAGRVWHGVCLCCSQCHCQLQTHPSLYWRQGNIYCQRDYCRLFGIGRCARCSQPIPSSTMVMRSGSLTFHPQCFSCQECDATLTPGSLYCMQGQDLYCQSHYHGNGSAQPSHDLHPKPNSRGEESLSSPEPRLDDRAAEGRVRRRTKRIRTCFRSEQLRALESYFTQKHNPDGKDWTCLAHKTGLPKRVLQVWFQNARAKLRRSLSSDDSPNDSPCALQGAETMATNSTPPTCFPSQSQAFHTTTIDHLQLSLITAPLGIPPQSPTFEQSQELKDSFFLDCVSQVASGSSSLREAYGEFGEPAGGAERDEDSDMALRPYYC
ncbi:LIM/homeobox protein Lhx9-like [Lampris incognitus]|uniref:LIM/homeobox protein Lhx9-like n=1 Tax=Lampris incognitus TaxID=2546036 RepID=UPI0024B59AEB|nr:LIM/homeobox protein Lhx9-like [Lampris incognitus]